MAHDPVTEPIPAVLLPVTLPGGISLPGRSRTPRHLRRRERAASYPRGAGPGWVFLGIATLVALSAALRAPVGTDGSLSYLRGFCPASAAPVSGW